MNPNALTASGPGPRQERGAPSRTTRIARRTGMYLLLLALALVTVTPFIVMLLLSFKTPGIVTVESVLRPGALTLQNFRDIFAASGIGRWTVNSLVFSIVSVTVGLFLASLAGYAFAKKRFLGKEVVFWSFLAMIMVPGQVTLIPLFILIAKAGGVDTFWGLILPTLANAQGVFMMRQFIAGIPDELVEAATIDGASEFRIYWQIVLPQTYPVLATLATFGFLARWNDFLWPLVVSQSDHTRTLTVGLAALNSQTVPLGTVMAGAAISFVPSLIVFIALQRYFVRGLVMSGLK